MKLKKGFSLIELTVVIGLLSLLMLAITTTMLMSMITGNRIRTATKVKQAGSYALTQIQSMIRNAKAISLCDSSAASLTLTNLDGGSTQIIAESDGTNVRIASGSGTYLTPENLSTYNFSLVCQPSDTEPNLVNLSFDLKDSLNSGAVDNPLVHFETSVNLRNQ